MEEPMRNRLHLALLLALALPVTPGRADLIHSTAPPEFTVEEQSVIHRNVALDQLVQRDPWLVRRALDEISKSNAEASPDFSDRTAVRHRYERPPQPERNPDLDHLGRSSPEAAHDLFLLIKKAAAGGKRTNTTIP
jgi:hypothetical protein